MRFEELRLAEPILRAVAAEGYSLPTPIQAQAIPHVIEGRDLLGCAQTGTGKTAAFALPILHRLSQSNGRVIAGHGARPDMRHPATSHQRTRHGRPIRCLVLSPTRELALQISDSFRSYGRFTGARHTVVYGGVSQNPQTQALHDGVDILVATPGRLLDLMNQGFIDLRSVEMFVLDEADRMLDMGFIPDIRRIVAKLPAKRQTLFFSATMPSDIRKLADSILSHPVSIQVAPVSAPATNVEHSVYFVEKQQKSSLLTHLLNNTPISRALIFARTKHGADRIAKHLHRAGIRADAIHGQKSQSARQRVLGNFRSNKTSILVATDIAARGLDIDEISHVINYDMPNVPETYVHRIGRTARAGASGVAVSFCDQDERSHLKAIERLIRQHITVQRADPAVSRGAPATAKPHATSTPHHQSKSMTPAHSPAAAKPVPLSRRDRHDPAQGAGRQRFWGRKRRRSGQSKRTR
jgi:ATP-dependent RNA helicase RhlE